jgi:hypothetical protein
VIANTSSVVAPPARTTPLGKAIVVSLWTEAAFIAAKAVSIQFLPELTHPTSRTIAALHVFVTGLLAVWTHRACRCAQARGVADLQPVWAAGSWFLPGFQFFVPHIFLRRSVRDAVRTASITRWQVTSLVAFAISWVGGRYPDDVRSAALATGALVGAIAAVHAGRSIATTERPAAQTA